MAISNRGNESRVGILRKDGTTFKLLHDNVLREMMLEWIKEVPVAEICDKYHITRVQFYRQKYHTDRVLKDFLDELREMRRQGMNSLEMSKIVGISLEQMNKIIVTMLL